MEMQMQMQKYVDKKFTMQFAINSVIANGRSKGDLEFKIYRKTFVYVDNACIRHFDFKSLGFYQAADMWTKEYVENMELTPSIICYMKMLDGIYTFYDFSNNQEILIINGEAWEFSVGIGYFGIEHNQKEIEWASDSDEETDEEDN
jgi:hypothetical protein